MIAIPRIEHSFTFASSGSGMNLNIGGTGPKQKWGGTGPVQRAGKKIYSSSCPSTFLALRVQLVVLVSTFVMVSTVWSLSCLLFFYSQ